MNEEIAASRLRITRRRALVAGGSVALGALLTGCGLGRGSAGDTVEVVTSTGEVATVTPTTAGGELAVSLLDGARSCQMTSEETQGPYWFDVDSIRSDVREGHPGSRLDLALRVQDVSGCSAGGTAQPVPDAVVEIWHCDAGGVYSGFESSSPGGGQGGPSDGGPGGPAPGGGPGSGGPGGGGDPTGGGNLSDGSYSEGDSQASPGDDGTFLRGAQVAGGDGIVRFTTIYPGWYRGRPVHIHLSVHLDRSTVLTSQLYFDESLNAAVFATSPYGEHTGRDTFNDGDGIFDESGMLTTRATDDGHLAVINLGVDV